MLQLYMHYSIEYMFSLRNVNDKIWTNSPKLNYNLIKTCITDFGLNFCLAVL